MTTLVTTYRDPDLDGTACSIAYAELLRAQGTDAIAGIFGTPDVEAVSALSATGIATPADAAPLLAHCDAVVLTDTTEAETIDPALTPQRVVEIIDHRTFHEAARFTRAHVQVEPLGAAATLITERYRNAGVTPSRAVAALLYGAIASHTIRFRAGVTTQRDRDAAVYLQRVAGTDTTGALVDTLFRAKSTFADDAAFAAHLMREFAVFEIADRAVGIVQLEVCDALRRVRDNRALIAQILADGKRGANRRQQELDYVFLTAIDLDAAYNVFLAPDAGTRTLLSELFNCTFDEQHIAQHTPLLMRKEITPRLAAHFARE